jgi:hypothetical protein
LLIPSDVDELGLFKAIGKKYFFRNKGTYFNYVTLFWRIFGTPLPPVTLFEAYVS